MKKLITLVMALLMVFACCAATAETAEEIQDNPEMVELFDSDWVSGTSHIMIFPYGEEANVQIMNDNETVLWLYTCKYDPEQKALVTIPGEVNTKHVREVDEEGSETGRTVEYEDGAAVFTVNADGYLIWKDEKEDAGAGRVYERIGWFRGDWECTGADGCGYQCSVYWDMEEVEEENGPKVYTGYKVNIVKYGQDDVVLFWDYAGQYNKETGVLKVSGSKSYLMEEGGAVENAYDNGSAEFTIEDNCLIWKDLTEEDAGAGLVFESANG